MIGKTISHYKILEKIGEGGMGVVYKAEDTKLERLVALKFLPQQFSINEEEKSRFILEAKAAAALDHTNICNVYEIDETEDGQMFIAMAYYEGVTLRDKIKKGPLNIDEALKIAIQVSEGLHEAHEKGIVHRDIKSANIIITDKGIAKILDFGLAKLKGQSKLTKVGTTVGTAAYMSPEQTQGAIVDHRSDIWSLGVVLYEMLTGITPFKGDYEQAVIYSILNEEPEPVSTHRTDVPENLESIIYKALVKDQAERFQSINEILVDLNKLKIVSVELAKEEKSIIVLPFDDMSPDKDNEYFSDGLTEELITDLSHIQDLLVISRSSAMTFKGKDKKIKEIAREVNVQYVLEGSVRKAGNNLRITAQLIDATTDAHLWAEKYSGTLDDVFEIQEKVSRSIVDALKIKLSPVEDKQIAEHPIEDIQAYEYYKKAFIEILKSTEESINQALRYSNSALEIIGDNAYVYSGIALSYWSLVNIGVKQDDYIKLAEDNINKALELNPDLSIPHALSGFINMFKGKNKLAARDLKIAITKNPDEPTVLMGINLLYVVLIGHIHLATSSLEKLIKIDPLDFMVGLYKGCPHFYSGAFDKALTEWSKVYKLYPDIPFSWLMYALGLAYNNRVDEVISFIDIKVETLPDHIFLKILLMLKYALINDTEKLNQILTPELITTCKRDGMLGHYLAGFFAIANEKDQALDWLENAVNAGFINYPMLSEKDIFLENIRAEKRFELLMKRVKHEWENFEE